MIDIIVPVTAHIACPDRNFRYRPVASCIDCPAFDGFTQVQEQGSDQTDVPFEALYRVQCSHPINRRMTTVESN